MTYLDKFMLCLTAWRENRGGGQIGMQSVINCIVNRCAKDKSTPYQECIKRLQFSSLTATGDPELTLWPQPSDVQWLNAQDLVTQAEAGTLADLTGGATLYYAPASIKTTASFTLPDGSSIPFPQGWNAAVVRYTVTVEGQAFFTD
jgi:hypothetical protein